MVRASVVCPQICRWLELGLVVDWKGFPGFREAFDTGEIAWDIDSAPFRQRAVEIYRGTYMREEV